MAVDEWLLETASRPLLRVYRWEQGWGSLGYFGRLAVAATDFPELKWVRRWTGGGTVDHRADWTYTLIVPAGESLSQTRGAESYRLIHAALGEVLRSEGRVVRLSAGDEQTGAASCFENPVCYDLVDASGQKIAGAGQRRSRLGLLHQGSVAGICPEIHFRSRAGTLADALANETCEVFYDSPQSEIDRRSMRYADAGWTGRR